MSIKERAHATIEAGYRAFRFGAMDLPANTTYNTRERVNHLRDECAQAREGVGKDGDWVIDFHQRFDLADAIRGCDLIEDLAPFFVEDPVRAEAFLQDIPILRQKVNVPLAAGEEWGNRWDFNKLVEDHDIDFVRATLPNVGGITEMMKIAAICETHFVGIAPHFTGPIATAALVNSLGTFSRPVLMEYNYQGRTLPHLPVCLDFKNGKLYPNDTARPGRRTRFQATHADRRNHGTGNGPRPNLLPPGWFDHELVSVCGSVRADTLPAAFDLVFPDAEFIGARRRIRTWKGSEEQQQHQQRRTEVSDPHHSHAPPCYLLPG